MDKFVEPSYSQGKQLEFLARAMDVFREIDTAFPMSYAVAFLRIGLEPGHGPSYYARKMGLAQAVTSRLILEIGIKSRRGGDGLGLVDCVSDPEDLRGRKYFLTPKGKVLLKRILGE